MSDNFSAMTSMHVFYMNAQPEPAKGKFYLRNVLLKFLEYNCEQMHFFLKLKTLNHQGYNKPLQLFVEKQQFFNQNKQ